MKTSGIKQLGEIRPSIWLNNEIIGRWELEKKNKEYKIVYELYKTINSELNNMINTKKKKLEDFVNTKLAPISS
ncbi:MAG: hypothetical protein ACXAC7_19080 [Candidatus Hodarchaeales archaeon]